MVGIENNEPVQGVCTCGNDLWHWSLLRHEITLVCMECGKEAHFTVPYPFIDIMSDAVKRVPTKGD